MRFTNVSELGGIRAATRRASQSDPRPVAPRRRWLNRAISAALAVALAGSLAAACSSGGDVSGSGGGGSGKGLPSGTYTFGTEALTSGPAALAGKTILDGMNFAVSEINGQKFLGDGANIKLDTFDSGGDPAKAISALNQWDQENVTGILFGILTTVAGASKPVLVSKKIPSIVAGSLLPGLPQPPYIYRPQILLNASYSQLVARYIKVKHPTTAVTVVTSDNDGMVSDGKSWTSALEQGGVKILKSINVSTSDTSFSGPAASIASSSPDVVVLSTLGNNSALLIKGLRDAGYNGPILTNYGVATESLIKIAGSALHDVYYSAAYSQFSTYPVAAKFTAAYKAAKGVMPDAFVAFGYNTVWYAATALKASDGTRQGLVEALGSLKSFESVYGALKIVDGQAELADPSGAQFLTFDPSNSPTAWTPPSS